MTAGNISDRLYAALLYLYPAGFREEYGHEMRSAFANMCEADTRSPLRFWTFIVADVFASAARQRLDGLRWLATALFGLCATVGTAHSAMFVYRYFYHPYFEDTSMPALPCGIALGLVLGLSVAAAQWELFPAAERRTGRWALASAVALPVAVLFCSTAIEQALDGLSPVIALHPPVALDLLVIGPLGNWRAITTQFAAMATCALLVRALMLSADLKVRGYNWD